MSTFGSAVQQITIIAQSHPMVERVLFEFDSKIAEPISKNETFPVVLIKPQEDIDVVYKTSAGVKDFIFEIEVLDKLEKSRDNLLKVISDCERILNYIIASLVNGNSVDFSLTEENVNGEFVHASRLDYLAGAKAQITLITVGESPCKVVF